MRHVILHHHIFKNAGSTFDFALERAFGVEFASFHDDNATGTVDEDMLVDWLRRNPEINAATSHHFHAQDYVAALRKHRCRILNCAFVRRPVRRLLSIYKQYRKQDEDTALGVAAKGPLDAFIDLLIERYPHFIDNVQVNIFANHGFYSRAIGFDDFERARDWFLTFAVCAPVERFAEAIVVLEYTLSSFSPEHHHPDLAYVDQNVGEPIPREENLRDIIGLRNLEWLSHVNRQDEALWQAADEELNRRILAVPKFEVRLSGLRSRCEALRCVYEQTLTDA